VDKGSYKGRRVDFSNYAASFFNPYIFSGSARSVVGCGAAALALLTGAAPEVIAKKHRGAHYSDGFMVRYLRDRRFSVLQLTLCNLSAATAKIGTAHVLLLSQLFRQNEGTWGVIFNWTYYHNFQSYSLDALSFLNKPILSAYVVVHPKWRMYKLVKAGSISNPRARTDKPRLNALDLMGGAKTQPVPKVANCRSGDLHPL
jgi:hypothetical protein